MANDVEEKLIVKKKSDLDGTHVTRAAAAGYDNAGEHAL